MQRLWKALHRDDPEAVPIPARDARVRPGGYEKDIHTGFARADRLLLDGADREHGAVELELAGGGDLVAAVRVVTELFHQTERECEAGGRAADACCVDADPDRKLADEGAGLVDEDPDRGGTSVLETADRPDRRLLDASRSQRPTLQAGCLEDPQGVTNENRSDRRSGEIFFRLNTRDLLFLLLSSAVNVARNGFC